MAMCVSLTGADLVTGSNMVRTSVVKSTYLRPPPTRVQYTAVAAFHGRLSLRKMLLHWFLCFWGNLAGALFVMAIIIGCECAS